jgi:hypothetical protein
VGGYLQVEDLTELEDVCSFEPVRRRGFVSGLFLQPEVSLGMFVLMICPFGGFATLSRRNYSSLYH